MFNKIEELLKSHNMTLNKLSKTVGLPYMTLKNWKLRGSSPRLENVKKIADYFEVPVEYFFWGRQRELGSEYKHKNNGFYLE